ncbi:MAG: two-component system response regulator, partial [Syntrophales bacterium]|nr:two-component system response regulator [Syntrophales bacterium]
KGDDIPRMARIIAVADVYDALTADRPYRKGLTLPEVKTFFREQSGKMFDPDVVASLFRTILKQ